MGYNDYNNYDSRDPYDREYDSSLHPSSAYDTSQDSSYMMSMEHFINRRSTDDD